MLKEQLEKGGQRTVPAHEPCLAAVVVRGTSGERRCEVVAWGPGWTARLMDPGRGRAVPSHRAEGDRRPVSACCTVAADGHGNCRVLGM